MHRNARPLRTFEERVFATLLDALAIDYHTQVTFYDYWLEHLDVSALTVDFVIYRPACIVFEIDGPNHRQSWRQKRKDRMRDEFLQANGFRVVRVANHELHDDDTIRALASRIWALLIEGRT